MKTVRLYDFDTRQLTEIPADELASGYVRAKIEGIEGFVFVEAKEGVAGKRPFLHPAFDEDRKLICKAFAHAFADVYPITAAQWEEGFRRDRDMEREIAMWSQILRSYVRLTEFGNAGLEWKRDCFNLLLSCANNGFEKALLCTERSVMSRKAAQRIIRELRGR